MLVGERIRLCKRLVSSPCQYTQWVLEASAAEPQSWISRCADECVGWCNGRLPRSPPEWQQVFDRWHKDAVVVQSERRWSECINHHSLCHYQPGMWVCEGVWGVNNFIHDKRLNASQAREISWLLVGGQGLRGRDTSRATEVTVNNCCVWCLQRGARWVESLWHVVCECPEYDVLRQASGVRRVLSTSATDIFVIHRGRWKWRELRTIRQFLLDLLEMRRLNIGRYRGRAATVLQEKAEALWKE